MPPDGANDDGNDVAPGREEASQGKRVGDARGGVETAATVAASDVPAAQNPLLASPLDETVTAGTGESSASSDRDGQLLDGLALPERFQLKGVLGHGGMGLVVEAHDRTLNRDVAVKFLTRGDEGLRIRFLREARAAAVLRHPGIVTLYDIDLERSFMVMELVRGESLKDRLRGGRLPVDEVYRIARLLLGALAVAHEAGIVHRDVKPANVLLDAAGAVKLADFGIASFGDSDLTTTGSQIGTPAYMPPEQLRGRRVDERADVYSAGATLFEVATGEKLHSREGSVEDPGALVYEACGDRRLAAAISMAVQERPEDRFPTARAFLQALDADISAVGAGGAETLPGAPCAGQRGVAYGGRGRRGRGRCRGCGGVADADHRSSGRVGQRVGNGGSRSRRTARGHHRAGHPSVPGPHRPGRGGRSGEQPAASVG